MRFACLLAVLLANWTLAAQQCRTCHPGEADEHATSAHARSLQPVLQSEFYRSLPLRAIGEARGGFLLTYQKDDAGLRLTARRDSEVATALIQWVFGAGRQAETPVAVAGPVYLEHRISYYANDGRFDLTMGHARGVSPSAYAALGKVQSTGNVERCFGCHSTGGFPGQAGTSSFQPGVQCERCHEGAREHAARGTAVTNPGRLKPKALVTFCATCHRDQPEGNPDDAINVRYQAVRLRRSPCFRGGNLSCLTCHDPHSNARRDVAWYKSRCLECHADAHAGQNDRGDCLECHMVKVSPLPHLVFTDHYIRLRPRT